MYNRLGAEAYDYLYSGEPLRDEDLKEGKWAPDCLLDCLGKRCYHS